MLRRSRVNDAARAGRSRHDSSADGDGVESDAAFIDRVYRELLDRPADEQGLRHFGERLSHGEARADVVLALARSDEYTSRVVRDHFVVTNVRELRPDRYREVVPVGAGDDAPVPVYVADSPDDFDWIEHAILEFGYYDRPGIWSLGVDTDKRLMAELLGAFAPARALDLGCSSGAVIQCLDDLGIYAEGVEISRHSIQRARPDVAARIHCGDVLDLELEPYDLVYGLDIFEHFNPNRLDSYLDRVAALVTDGGFLFANVPAFGADTVFGEVFDVFLEEWEEDRAAGRNFSLLQVDTDGYPMHGHLVWAATDWWQRQFERVGLQREPEIERSLHAKYDAAMEKISVARKAYYVFSKHATRDATGAVIARVRADASSVAATIL